MNTKTDTRINILIIENDESIANNIKNVLTKNGFETIIKKDMESACKSLNKENDVSVILFNSDVSYKKEVRLFLKIQQEQNKKYIPVIILNCQSTLNEVMEVLDIGAFYYLKKPFKKQTLIKVIKIAIDKNMNDKTHIKDINLKFKRLEDVISISNLISNFCYIPNESLVGIRELMLNAVEHGNLGITFEEKAKLLHENKLMSEIETRLNHDNYKDKEASLNFKQFQDYIEITIEDAGEGFNPEPYMEIDDDRASMLNGKGILIAKQMSFDSIEYFGKGNKVVCKIKQKATQNSKSENIT